MFKEFYDWASKKGWRIEEQSDIIPLPSIINNRYSNIPLSWKDFISRLTLCCNQSETVWFLTPNDFLQKPEEQFQWNELELQSIESADEDQEIKEYVISYWDKHMPIIMSVDGEYSYYAINMENGNVVYGYEPEYEESTIVAADFNSFIEKVMAEEIIL